MQQAGLDGEKDLIFMHAGHAEDFCSYHQENQLCGCSSIENGVGSIRRMLAQAFPILLVARDNPLAESYIYVLIAGLRLVFLWSSNHLHCDKQFKNGIFQPRAATSPASVRGECRIFV